MPLSTENFNPRITNHHDEDEVVHYYGNERDPSRCFVRPFKKYRSLCPNGVVTF